MFNLAIFYSALCVLISISTISLALCFGSGIDAIARNPSQTSEIQGLTFVGAAFIELITFIGIVIYFIVYFKQ